MNEQKNEMNTMKCPKQIVFDESLCFHVGFRCRDYLMMDLSETDNYGNAWCNHFNRYENPNSAANDCPGRPNSN